MSTITLYTDTVTIEPANKTQFEVTLENIDASDFVSEFIASEILDAMDFSDIEKYVTDRQGEDE